MRERVQQAAGLVGRSCHPHTAADPQHGLSQPSVRSAPLKPSSHLLLGKAGVDDIHDAVDGQRRLCNVGGDNDFAAGGAAGPRCGWRRVKDALLLLRRQRGVEGVHLDRPHAVAHVVHLRRGGGGRRRRGVRQARAHVGCCKDVAPARSFCKPLSLVGLPACSDPACNRYPACNRCNLHPLHTTPALPCPSQLPCPPALPACPHLLDDFAARVLNLLLARQKHQDVARRLARVDLHHRADGRLQVVALRLLREGGDRREKRGVSERHTRERSGVSGRTRYQTGGNSAARQE